MSYRDEMKKLTLDPACHRLGEIADQLEAKVKDLTAIVDACCGDAARPVAPPAAATTPTPSPPADRGPTPAPPRDTL